MRIRLLLFLGTLLSGIWPGMLLAYAPAQLPQSPSTSSFLLVATPQLRDPRFRETVVLVTRRGHAGPVGIIVNRPQNTSLDKALPAYPAAGNARLFYGGPVEPHQISFFVRGAEAASGTLKISERLYLANDMPLLGELLSGKRAHAGLRVVNGVAAWAPGQLENEIARGDWLVLPIDEAAIFDRPAETMWPELYRRANSNNNSQPSIP